MYVSESYDRTIIGRQARDHVWIMARTPQITQAAYGELLAIVEREGYDVKEVRRVPQRWKGADHVAAN